MSLAAVLLAVALLASGGRTRANARLGLATRRSAAAAVAPRSDPLAEAAAFDVLAACLQAGMAVASAAAATAPSAPPMLGRVLDRAADLLALGSDAGTAWSAADGTEPRIAALCRLARRSAASGAALAHGVADLAEQSRQDAADAAPHSSSARKSQA